MYTLEERQIFVCQVGNLTIKADPITVNRKFSLRLKKDGRDLDALLTTIANSEKADEVILDDALDVVLDAVRAEFKVKSFEEDPDNGLTETETLNLLGKFLDFVMEELKKNEESLPNGSESITSSPGDEDSITPITPDSGSTGTE